MDIRPFFRLAAVLILLALAADAAAGPPAPGQAGPAQARELQPDGPRVLVIHSYAQDYAWTRDLHQGILSVLDAPDINARWRVEYLDSKHHSSPAYLARTLDLFREKYSGTRFDGIILTDDHALDFVAMHRDELFPGIPIVACGINDLKSVPRAPGT
jgi:hypothetical protein